MEKVLSAPALELSSQNECLAHSQGSTVASYTRATATRTAMQQPGEDHITLPAV